MQSWWRRLILLLIVQGFHASAHAEIAYQGGFGKADITPKVPLRLSGYGERSRPFEGVDEKIYARAMALRGAAAKLHLLVSVDTIGFPGSLTKAIAQRVADAHGVPRSRFVLSCTHSHTTPHLHGGLTNLLAVPLTAVEQRRSKEYTEWMADQVLEAVARAIADLQPVRLSVAEGQVGSARNRRVVVEGRPVEFGPHTRGPSDLSLPVMKITDERGEVRGVVYNYACHCTTMRGSDNRVNGDWAGYASQAIEAQFPGATALCTIGCGADQDPQPDASISHAELAKSYGQQIASEVSRLFSGDMREVTAEVSASFGYAGLPFDRPPIESFEKLLEDRQPQTRRHANNMLALHKRMGRLPETYPDPVHVWRFDDQLCMVFLGGEVVVDYALRLRKEIESQQVWVSAYCDDVFGYVASERIRREGGYEALGSMVYYNQPGPWAEGTEELLIRRIHEIDKLGGAEEPLSCEAALDTFHLSPGFEIGLVAAEPLIADPVNFEVGVDGRLWVVEMGDYPNGAKERGGRLRLLEDTNGDGRYDHATTFLDALPYPNGIYPWRDGVLVSCGGKIVFARDTDGDDRADDTRTLYSGFEESNPQHRTAGFAYGLDNWLYLSGGTKNGKVLSHLTGETKDLMGQDFRIEPDSGELEPVGGQTQFGRNRDDWGNWFGGDNSTPIRHYLIADRYLRRNPFVPATEIQVTLMKPEHAPPVFPMSRTVDRFNDLFAANRFTSACSPNRVRDLSLGEQSDQWALICEPVHNLVHRAVLVEEGHSFRAERHPDEQSSEFVASTDPWFRPTLAKTGPDGAVWIADMYRHVIEHPEWIPEAWQAQLDLRAGDQLGRIYRVFSTSQELDAIPNLDSLSSLELVEELKHRNGWRRDTAQRLLVHRGDPSIVAALERLLTTADPLAKVHALGTLDGLNALTAEHLLTALEATDSRVQRIALELCDPVLMREAQLQEKLLQLVAHTDQHVRLQLALTLGEWHDPRVAELLAQLLTTSSGDAVMESAILSSAMRNSADLLAFVVNASDDPSDKKTLINALIATTGGSQNIEQIKQVLAEISAFDEQPELWRFEAMSALEQSLRRQKTSLLKLLETANGESSPLEASTASILLAARESAIDSDTALDRRLAAIPLLNSSFVDEETWIRLLSAREPVEVQLAVVRCLAQEENEHVPTLLLANWSGLSPRVQSEILDALVSRPRWHEAILSAIEGGVIRTEEVHANVRARLISSDASAARERAKLVFVEKEPSKIAELGTLATQIDQLPGDVRRGTELFTAKCATCHHHNGQGKDFGPNLAALTDKSTPKLLEAILDPNRAIESKYKSYTCVTADGRALSGMILDESSNSLTLVEPNGTAQTLLRIDIDALQASDVSFMPTDLCNGFTLQSFADLLAFVRYDSDQEQ